MESRVGHSFGSVPTELLRCVEHFGDLALSKAVQRSAPGEPTVGSDEESVLHPFVMFRERGENLTESGHGSALNELPSRVHAPALSKSQAQQLAAVATLGDGLLGDIEVPSYLFRTEDAAVFLDQPGASLDPP